MHYPAGIALARIRRLRISMIWACAPDGWVLRTFLNRIFQPFRTAGHFSTFAARRSQRSSSAGRRGPRLLSERAAFVAASRGLCPRLLLHCAPISAPAVPAPPTHKARHGADGRELCSSPLTCRVAVPLRPDLPLTMHYDGPSRTELGEGLGPWAGMRDEACRAEQLNALPLCAPLP